MSSIFPAGFHIYCFLRLFVSKDVWANKSEVAMQMIENDLKIKDNPATKQQNIGEKNATRKNQGEGD
jgi:hypothetical protein